MVSLTAYRKNDAVVMVCQNNQKKSVEIAAINERAEQLTGFKSEELAGKPLSKILPKDITESIADYVEFRDDANDLGSVLGKVRNFRLNARNGNEVPLRLRIVRCEAMDHNPWFQMVLQDEAEVIRTEQFRQLIQENFKGHEKLHPKTELPDRNSIFKDLELVQYHVNTKQIDSIFAVLEIDHFEPMKAKYGEAICYEVHKHIANICKQRLRADDTVGTLDLHHIGLILMDILSEPARMALNRLRWAIRNSPLTTKDGKKVPISVSISFTRVGGKIGYQHMIQNCETYLTSARSKGGNIIMEVIELNRRTGERPDRRQRMGPPPASPDRRKKTDRRGVPEKD